MLRVEVIELGLIDEPTESKREYLPGMKNQKDSFSYFVIGTLAIIAAVLMILMALPQARQQIQDLLHLQNRIVLAKLQKELQFSDQKCLVTIIKLKKGSHLLVEVYRQDQESSKLISSFEFKNESDAQLEQPQGTSNLFLADRNFNGTFDIIVPALDQQLNPRTHVIEFHKETQSFQLATAPAQ